MGLKKEKHKIAKNITLDENVVDAIKKEAELQERSESWIINKVLKEYYKIEDETR